MALKGRIALSNFSTGRDATYQILKGTGGIFVEGNNVAEVFIYLPTLSIVSFVSATYKRNSMSIGLRAQLKDVNNGDVGPSSHILWDDPTSETVNTWQTRSTTLAPGHHPSIVDHVAFQAGWNFGKGWLDDLIVEYKPGDLNANRNTGESDCDIARTGTSSVGNPIEVRGGEKREHIVDLQVNSPGAPLTFERRYRHTKRDDFDQMGLGWIHNHLIELIPPQSGEIMVQIATGGEAYFTETDPVNNPDHYDGVAGVDSFIDWDGVAQEYRLETPARNIYVFDSAGKLLSRTFANGEVWRYNYDGNDRLSEVADDYSRKLIFSYYSGLIGADAFKNDQLWRVGDHTASGLNGGSPSGRYIEFDYVSEKDDGVEVTTPRALLSSVADVRGEGWLYDYYGQDSGENDSNLLNILTRRESPDVDVTGNGNNDGVITLEEIAYTLNVGGVITDINQKRGGNLLETDFAFQPNGDNLTTESVAGQVTTHHFQGEVFAGSELPGANGAFATQIQNTTYRPFSNTDANGNATLLGWDTNGKLLDWIIDPLGNQIVFEYDTDERLTTSTDAEGRKTAYTYGDINNPRQPTQIDVLDVDGITLLRRQTFSYDTKGRVLSEKTLDPADGITVLQEVTRTYYTVGDGNGLLHQVTQKDIGGTNDVTTTFTYDSAGRVIKTQQNSNFGSCDVAFTVYDPAGNVLASICNYDPGLNPDPTTAAEAAALYDPSQPDKNRVTTHAYDSLGRRVSTTINAASNTEQTILTLYDALDRVIRTISNYKVQGTSAPGDWVFENGAWKTGPGGATISHGADETENIISDTDYNDRGFVRLQRDVLGNATLFGYDAAGRLIKTVQNASQPAYNNDYSGTSPDPELANYNPNANAAQDI
ncbi:MAG: RHS repeat protein, partial [Chloroflexi bacterium]